ncbi:MAG: hypothetical protein AB8G18_12410 [Gammaproteobacteria bacterium]
MVRFVHITSLARALPLVALTMAGLSLPAHAVGTVAGTDISNTASVSYTLNGAAVTENSSPAVVTVAEILDVDVTLQSPQLPVAPGDTNQAIVFSVTNTGNGTEAFLLAGLSTLPGDDFDPVLSTPDALFFDTDGSGDLSPGDTPYVSGTNDPVLAPDESVTVLLANDIPGGLLDTNLGQTQLTATSATGAGAAGTVVTGGGDAGVDAMVGASEGDDFDTGEYIIETINVTVDKTAAVSDPFGGTTPVPGAQITYQIRTTVVGTGTAAGAVVNDPVPANTTYVPGSTTLNGAVLTDAADADAGEFSGAGTSIAVQLGDLTAADGPQVVEFIVVID